MSEAWCGGVIFGVLENGAEVFQALASIFLLITLH